MTASGGDGSDRLTYYCWWMVSGSGGPGRSGGGGGGGLLVVVQTKDPLVLIQVWEQPALALVQCRHRWCHQPPRRYPRAHSYLQHDGVKVIEASTTDQYANKHTARCLTIHYLTLAGTKEIELDIHTVERYPSIYTTPVCTVSISFYKDLYINY